jgi:hypothetical protein
MRAKDEAELIRSMESHWAQHGGIAYPGASEWNEKKAQAIEAAEPWSSVLDLGIGDMAPWRKRPQLFTELMTEERGYLGVDGAAGPRDYARSHGLRAQQLGFSEWAAGAGPDPADFDLVVACDVLYHIPSVPAQKRFLERLFTARRVVITWANDPRIYEGHGVGTAGFDYFPHPWNVDLEAHVRGFQCRYTASLGPVHAGDQQLRAYVRG